MSVSQFSPTQYKDAEVNALQATTKGTLDTMTNKQILNGNLVTTKLITSTGTVIYHGLNRKALGYIVVSSTVPVTFSDDIQTMGNNTSSVTITSSASTVVNIWFF